MNEVGYPSTPAKPPVHDLKIWPQFFAAHRQGLKNFEIRQNDRAYQVGDILKLREWDPEAQAYTGPVTLRRVSYVSDFGLLPGYVAMGTRALAPEELSLWGPL